MHDLFRLREICVRSCHFHLTLSNVTVIFLKQIQIPCFWVTSSLLPSVSLCHLKARAVFASFPGALARQCTFTLNNMYSSSICSGNSQQVMILFSLQRCSLSGSQSPCTITTCSLVTRKKSQIYQTKHPPRGWQSPSWSVQIIRSLQQ